MQLAEEAVRRGFKAMKIKIGYPTLEEDLEVVKAVKSVLGVSVGLMVDYNQSLSVAEAMRRGRALDEFALNWIEEPVAQDDYEGAARVADAIETPVQRGENWFGTSEMRKSIEAGGTDLAMIDIMKIGGVSGWLRAAALAHAHQLPLSSHIFQEFSAQLMCVTPTAHWLEFLDVADTILEQPLKVKDGRCVLPTEAGAGISWKSSVVEKLRNQ
jgi:mandelate racemase